MRKTVALPFAGLVLTAILAAGCGGSGNLASTASGTPTPFASPSAACATPAGEAIQEVFPQNGATAAANLQGIVIAVAPNPLPTNWFFYVSFNTPSAITYPGTIGYFATPVPVPGSTAGSTPTPLPTPSDTPTMAASFGTPIFESASLGTFANNSKFTVYAASTTCFPGIQLSSFTTSITDQPTPTPSPTASPT
jgi:hypothetical protein